MQEIDIVGYDDLDRVEKSARTKTGGATRLVGLGGKWVQLDLTDDHAAELDALLARYMAAGYAPDLTPGSPRPPAVNTTTSRSRAQAYNAAMIAWAHANGHKITPPGPKGSSPYVPVATRKAYEEYLASLASGGGEPQ